MYYYRLQSIGFEVQIHIFIAFFMRQVCFILFHTYKGKQKGYISQDIPWQGVLTMFDGVYKCLFWRKTILLAYFLIFELKYHILPKTVILKVHTSLLAVIYHWFPSLLANKKLTLIEFVKKQS